MEITKTTYVIFNISRFLGFAPYVLHRNGNGEVLSIRRSKRLVVYSVSLIAILVCLTITGLIFDTTSPHPLRVKSSTSIVVIGLDVNVIVGLCLSGVISGIIGLRQTQEMSRRLQEADEALTLNNGLNNDKRNSIILAISVFGILGLILGWDICEWHKIAMQHQKTNKYSESIVNNVQYYYPFWAMYFWTIGLEIQFTQSALGIGRRYQRLNYAFRDVFAKERFFLNVKTTDTMFKTDNLKQRHRKPFTSEDILRKNEYNINRFAIIHETLTKSMNCMSKAFGVTLLILLTSCVLHLVVTGYFVLLSVINDEDYNRTVIQFVWLAVHFFRLLLIVEPCNLSAVEANKTIHIVSDIMRDFGETETLKTFWQQLVANEIYFSACGMCKIDRRLLTSLIGEIATYLVILMQFERQ